MVVYLLQDNGLMGSVYTLGIVCMIGQYQSRIWLHRWFQLGQRETEQTGDVSRLTIGGRTDLCLAVIAQGSHQSGHRQGRCSRIHVGRLMSVDITGIRSPVQFLQQFAVGHALLRLRVNRITDGRT